MAGFLKDLSTIGWAVSHGGGNGMGDSPAARRWVLTAPNKRRWDTSSLNRGQIHAVALALHATGLCAQGSPLDQPLPAGLVPRALRERKQRRCRACSETLELKHFTGPSGRSCDVCVRKLCTAAGTGVRVHRADIGACPACREPCHYPSVRFVQGVGLACLLCAAEARAAVEAARREAERAEVARLAQRELERSRLPRRDDIMLAARATAEDEAAFAALDAIAAAFG